MKQNQLNAKAGKLGFASGPAMELLACGGEGSQPTSEKGVVSPPRPFPS